MSKFRIFILLALILLNLVILNKLIKSSSFPINQAKADEIAKIKKTKDPNKQAKLYEALIARVGPEKAQDQLYSSGLPFDGQTHLLNHTVGNFLYQKYGSSGLIYCKDYFLSSCYHGFVLKVIGDAGLAGLDPVLEACGKKGFSVMTQCAHAIGHGLLTYLGYPNLTKALETCDQIGLRKADFPLWNCYDGVFMENIWGVHDGTPSPYRWVKEDDPTYPCSDQRIEAKYINACWAEQPTIMYQQFKGDIGRVSNQCLKLKNSTNQTTCFDSLARQINPLTAGNIDNLFQLCAKVDKDWQEKCIFSNVRAFFSVGDRNLPFKICEEVIDKNKQACYQTLVDAITANITQPQERKDLCNKIPDSSIKNQCS